MKSIDEMTKKELIEEYYRIEKKPPTTCGTCMLDRVGMQQKIIDRLKDEFDYIVIK